MIRGTKIGVPTPPGIDRRLRRLGPAVAPHRRTWRRLMTGGENVLIEDWCQQFPSHSHRAASCSVPEGALYVSGGEGASFNSGAGLRPARWHADGHADPGQSVRRPAGGANPIAADGRGRRAPQPGHPDHRRPDRPRRHDHAGRPRHRATAWPTTPTSAAAIRTPAGSSPTACAIRSGSRSGRARTTSGSATSAVDVGGGQPLTEPERAPPATSAGRATRAPASLPSTTTWACRCARRSAPGDVTAPYYAYNHPAGRRPATAAATGSSSISGLAFLPSSSAYPSSYDSGLFFTDYTPQLHLVDAGRGQRHPNVRPASGSPTSTGRIRRPTAGSVFLTIGPTGDLMYADYDRGEIRRIHYYGATCRRSRLHGDAVLRARAAQCRLRRVRLDRRQRRRADVCLGPRRRRRSTTMRPASRVANLRGRRREVGLKVTDPDGASGTTTRTVSAGNSPPTVSITAPASNLTWTVGQTVSFSGTASDTQDGTLPASAFELDARRWGTARRTATRTSSRRSGVKSGTFDAPDHEYPSHLKLSGRPSPIRTA